MSDSSIRTNPRRRAVEHDVALERLLELALGHLHVLVDAQIIVN